VTGEFRFKLFRFGVWKVVLAVILGLIAAGIGLWVILEIESKQEPVPEPPRQEQGWATNIKYTGICRYLKDV